MNKKMISLALVVAMLGAPSVSLAQKLSSGKPVSVRLTSDIESNGKIRNEVTAIVDRDVKDAATDAVLIKRGTPVVIDAHIQKARGVGKPAAVKLTCLSTKAVDGQEIALQGALNEEGDSRKGTALGVGIGVGVFCWPALFCLCIKGEKINIPANTLIHNIVVNDDYMIKAE